jgi:hypothetical protein
LRYVQDMRLRQPMLKALTPLVMLAASGCASSALVANLGQLDDTSLVTLIVTSDLRLVEKECAGVPATAPLMGCEVSIPAIRGTVPVRAVKVVRYTETMPTALSFEIDARSLCHTVAALQLLTESCETVKPLAPANTAGIW